jgi:sulfoxide reductase heme-binding subunit YedZ
MAVALASLAPWNDRAGKLSGLRLAVFLGCIAPMAWLVWQLATGNAGSKPLTHAIHESGDWAVRLLLLSLLVTPLRSLADWPRLIAVRRMIGLAALSYVLAHLAFYVAEQGYDLAKVAGEIVRRFYLTIGTLALAGLLALGVTSTDGMVRRLGAVRWNRLHATVYLLTALALLHFLLQRKLEVYEPILMSGLFLWLMGFRALRRQAPGAGLPGLLALSAGAALATALLEAAWYAGMTGAMASRVLAANLDFTFEIRPAWWVLATGLALAGLYAARGRSDRRRPAETATAIRNT